MKWLILLPLLILGCQDERYEEEKARAELKFKNHETAVRLTKEAMEPQVGCEPHRFEGGTFGWCCTYLTLAVDKRFICVTDGITREECHEDWQKLCLKSF